MSLGTISCLVYYNHFIPLWTLLQFALVSSLDINCWCNTRDCVCVVGSAHNQLFPKISLAWAWLPTAQMEAGKYFNITLN